MYKTKVRTQCFKTIIVELTYELFVHDLLEGDEYCFGYNNKKIDIAFHDDNGKTIYAFSITNFGDKDCSNGIYQEFNSPEELLEKVRIYDKTIKEVWDDLEKLM